jgi:hypothetical protein
MIQHTGLIGSTLAAPVGVIPAYVLPANTIRARDIHWARSPSDWVYAFIRTCNDELAVWFRLGQKIIHRYPVGPGRYVGVGGVPAVCCLYPTTAGAYGRTLFNLSLSWPFGGELVWAFLYKKLPYRIVQPPPLPIG